MTANRICENTDGLVRRLCGGMFRTGFSLVEVLMVIFIIALMLAILIPSLGKAKSMAMGVKCSNNLKQIDVAMNLYTQANDETYPCAKDPVSEIFSNDPNVQYWLWMGRGWRFLVKPYLDININISREKPSVLLCPQDRLAKVKFESTSYGYSMAFYHSPEQIDSLNNPAYPGKTSLIKPSMPQKRSNVARPGGKILVGEWLSNHFPTKGDDKGWWAWNGCRNYLFADGQIRFLKAKEIRQANDKLPDVNLTKGGINGQDWPTTPLTEYKQ